jgi:cytoskeletal protein RodZ
MTGPVEEVGKVANTFMTSMSNNPVMLGMVIVVLSMIGMLWYTLRYAAEARKTEFEMIFAQQKEVNKLLSDCTVRPQGSSGNKYKPASAEDEPVLLKPGETFKELLEQAHPKEVPK